MSKSSFSHLLEALFPLLVVTFGVALTALLTTFTTPWDFSFSLSVQKTDNSSISTS